MTTAASQTEVPAGRSYRHGALRLLIVLLGVWYAAMLAWHWYRDTTEHPLRYFAYPASTALYVVHGDMLLWQGQGMVAMPVRVLPPLTGWYVESFPEDDEKILRDTIAYLETENGEGREVSKLRAALAIILAETGSTSNAFKQLDILTTDSKFSAFARAARAIYSNKLPDPDLNRTNVCNLLETYWHRWAFDLRWLLLTREDFRWSGHLATWQEDQAKSKLHQLAVFSAFEFTAMAFGLWLLTWRLLPRVSGDTTATASPLAPWSAWEGWGLFLGTMAVGETLWLCNRYLLPNTVLDLNYILVLYGPVLVFLFLRHGSGSSVPFWRIFGLHEIQARWRFLLAASFALFALQFICDRAMAEITSFVGIKDHWTDFFSDAPLSGGRGARFWAFVDTLIWAPVFEEILFRGILYSTLRARFGIIISATLSGLLFASTHFYDLGGFIYIGLMGFWNALAFQVTRSLVPCIVVHMLINLFWTGTVTLYAV